MCLIKKEKGGKKRREIRFLVFFGEVSSVRKKENNAESTKPGLLTDHDPTRRSGQEDIKSRGSNPVGSGDVRNITGRIGSGRVGPLDSHIPQEA